MIADDVQLGKDVTIPHPDLVNLYGCEIGDGCKIGAFVEIRKQVSIGSNVKIQAFVFIPEGVTIEDGVFIGPHVCFTNDKYPEAVDSSGDLLAPGTGRSSPHSSNAVRVSALTLRSSVELQLVNVHW